MIAASSQKTTTRRWKAALTAFCFLSASPAAFADAPGDPLYGPYKRNEGIEYPRVIRLAHAGRANGTLLATFEHTMLDGSPGSLVIRRSTDDDATWSTAAIIPEPNRWPTMWQPFLLELPKRIGKYPEGTILLAENSSDKPRTQIFLFSSADEGSSWQKQSLVTRGDGDKRGVWEPFLFLDAAGRLVMFLSDERQHDRYSQFLGGYVFDETTNRFDTAHEIDLASGSPTDRPGMVTIAHIPGRGYMASFEVCSSLRVANCPVHTKFSPDGVSWPEGLGDAVSARDGQDPANNPYLVWSPVGGRNGRLTMISEYSANAPSAVMLINQSPDFRPDAWQWAPRPYLPAHRQYSASLLPSPDGMRMRQTGGNRPFVLTASANAGVLPYRDPFGRGADEGWLDFGGAWRVSREAGAGVYTDAGGPGSKAIAGQTGWRNIVLSSDIRLNQPGQAGVLVRASKPGIGADALDGYFIGINSATGVLFGGREDGGWSGLASVPAPHLATGRWYNLTVSAHGPAFRAVLRDKADDAVLGQIVFTDARFATGAIGVRDFNASASWRDVRAVADGVPEVGAP